MIVHLGGKYLPQNPTGSNLEFHWLFLFLPLWHCVPVTFDIVIIYLYLSGKGLLTIASASHLFIEESWSIRAFLSIPCNPIEACFIHGNEIHDFDLWINWVLWFPLSYFQLMYIYILCFTTRLNLLDGTIISSIHLVHLFRGVCQ